MFPLSRPATYTTGAPRHPPTGPPTAPEPARTTAQFRCFPALFRVSTVPVSATLPCVPSAVRVLLLAGTTEAAALARHLDGRDGVELTASFAGRTSAPRQIASRQRVGGFGGAGGMASYLAHERIDAVIDATHPFAAHMRWNAADACDRAGIPRVRVERPPWTATAADRWTHVAHLADAPAAIGGASRVFLTTGRQDLAPFAGMADVWFLVRSIEAPDPMPLANAEVILDRGPFSVEGERSLLADHRIEVLVTKNSGGEAAAAKLTAAAELGVEVVMVDRPASPPGPQVSTVDGAVAWLNGVVRARARKLSG